MVVKYLVETADFDSQLGATPDQKDNATILTAVLKLEFIAVDAKTAKDLTGKSFRAQPWDDGVFRQYLLDFKKSVEDHWNDKMYIWFPNPDNPREAMSKNDYMRFVHPRSPKGTPPYLICRLLIKFCDKNCHAKIYVLNIIPGQGRFQNTVRRKADAPDKATLSNQSLDVTIVKISDRDQYRQLPAHHEIGHLLNLDHVNAMDPACQLDKNAEICYGGTPYDKNDVMGVGGAITGEHAKTWLKAIQLHTRHDKGWRASHLSPPLEALLDEAVDKRTHRVK